MSRVAALRQIEEAVQNPLKTIARWKARSGGKVVGCLACMPPFAPEELIHAAGMLPVGLWGAEIPVRLADAKLQSFACSVARTSLEMGLNEALSVCDGFLFPSTCDAFQNLSEFWKATTQKPCFKVTFPKQASGEAAR
ncbi:MAG: 2-hydroxyacyl-CoA dehydratase, partial [Thermodesulfobacteriota bacterium]